MNFTLIYVLDFWYLLLVKKFILLKISLKLVLATRLKVELRSKYNLMYFE